MRSFGHIPDHGIDVFDDLQSRHIGLLIGAAPVGVPAAIDYSHLLEHVPDQGTSSSCVGFAFATSVYLRAKIAGTPIERPSAKAIYDIARLIDAPHEAMLDQGSRPNAAIAGMRDYGLVAEERWPLTDANVNEPPPEDVFQHAIDAMISGYYRIASGDGAALLIKQALSRGFFPAFAMSVDSAFENLDEATVYDAPKGPSLGGHMQCFTGYSDGALIVAGSWGPGFADRGFARISERFVDSGGVTDILVPTIVPLKVA